MEGEFIPARQLWKAVACSSLHLVYRSIPIAMFTATWLQKFLYLCTHPDPHAVTKHESKEVRTQLSGSHWGKGETSPMSAPAGGVGMCSRGLGCVQPAALVWHTGRHLSWLVSLCTELGIVFYYQLCLWAWRYSNPQMHRNPSVMRAYTSTSLHMGAHGVPFFKSRRYRSLENMNWADLGCNNIWGKHSPASNPFLGLSLYVFISLGVRTHEWHWNGLKGHRHSLKKIK